MSPADSADAGPLRLQFGSELEQLSLQVEMMGVVVDENLIRMRQVLATGDPELAAEALAVDDTIDASNVSLTERCYEILRREAPVASDLRLIVSVLRITAELERVGDLALRIVKLAPDHELLTRQPEVFRLLEAMASDAVDLYRRALQAWALRDVTLAEAVATDAKGNGMAAALVEAVLAYDGPDAVAVALRTMVAGQALDRIHDHAAILGARVRYLVTGDPAHLAAEVR